MNTKAKEFLFTLLNTPSPAGFESEGQRVWMNYVRPFADSLENDAYGNVWATLPETDHPLGSCSKHTRTRSGS